MIIFPAIDLKDGQCVRLVQGKAENKTIYSDNPVEIAKSFTNKGAQWLHIVDLDGAFSGTPQNSQVIAQIAADINIPFQVGGGLRTIKDIKKTLALGAARVIIGTRAVTNQDFVKELIDSFGQEKIVLGLDVRNGMVAVDGWIETSSLDMLEFALHMKEIGIKQVVFTDISRDGLLQGPNLPAIKTLAINTGLQIIASGGVSSLENISELKQLESLGVNGAIIGKALYDGKLDLKQAIAAA